MSEIKKELEQESMEQVSGGRSDQGNLKRSQELIKGGFQDPAGVIGKQIRKEKDVPVCNRP